MSLHSYDSAKALMDEFHRRIRAGDDIEETIRWLVMKEGQLDTMIGKMWVRAFLSGIQSGRIAMLKITVDELKKRKARLMRG